MANPEHLAKLKEGVEAWNEWRDNNPDIIPDLQDHKFKFTFDEKPAPQGNNFKRIAMLGEQLEQINFCDTNLKGTTIIAASFKGAMLTRANLEGAYIAMTDFRGAMLGGVIFKQAHLSDVNFEEVWLHSANFAGANFVESNLKKANCMGASFVGAKFMWTEMPGARVCGVKYDNEMVCTGINVDGCTGSQKFVRHVRDLEYIQDFKQEHPALHRLWHITSDCGRSWIRLAGWCCAIIYFFWAVFDILKTNHPLVTSIMAFTSFGFVDASAHTTPELVFICIETILGYIMFGALVSIIASQMARRSG